MSTASKYASHVHDTMGWWGTFPLPYKFRVGDYFLMHNNEPKYMGSVLAGQPEDGFLTVEEFPYQAKEFYSAKVGRRKAADLGAGLDLGVVGADAGLTLDFTDAGGYELHVARCVGSRFTSVHNACRWMLALAADGKWEKEHVLVTEVISAKYARAIIADQSGASVSLNAGVNLPVDLSLIGLATPELALSVQWNRGTGVSSVCEDATPFYHTARIKRKWYGKRYAELQAESDEALDDVFEDQPFSQEEDSTDV